MNVAKNARRIIVLRDGEVVVDTTDKKEALESLQTSFDEERSSPEQPVVEE